MEKKPNKITDVESLTSAHNHAKPMLGAARFAANFPRFAVGDKVFHVVGMQTIDVMEFYIDKVFLNYKGKNKIGYRLTNIGNHPCFEKGTYWSNVNEKSLIKNGLNSKHNVQSRRNVGISLGQ